MIINPIIPIWLMAIICIIAIIYILYNSQLKNKILNKLNKPQTTRQKAMVKQHIVASIIKIAIVVLIFIINLRFMIPNGESVAMKSDLNILFVVDTSYSMRAVDYNGNKERVEGVMNDCCYIVDELSSCKFSIITFGDTAKRVIPFTYDTDMVQAELKSIQIEDEFYAKGSSMNIVKDVLEKTVADESKKNNGAKKVIVFFVTDGEITRQNETLNSFSSTGQYIANGAVLGYGTTAGGKLVDESYKDQPNSDFYYKKYWDKESSKEVYAISKLDEKNLKQIAGDLGIDYIQMSKQDNINYKINEIKQEIAKSQTTGEKISTYQDIYYYFAIPLGILLIIDLAIKKKKLDM